MLVTSEDFLFSPDRQESVFCIFSAMLLRFFFWLRDRLRLGRPWKYKGPFLISIPYFLIAVGHIPFPEALLAIVCALTTIIGIAGFGYLSNDWADREKDKLAGKPNALAGMPGGVVLGLLLFLLLMALLPWVLYFPVTWHSGVLLGAEFLLFIVYALPPFRFKEKGFAAVLCDAGYAHAVPALLAAWTFFLIGDRSWPHFELWLIGLGIWQFCLGMRNIVLHLELDYDSDLQSGTRTWPVVSGLDRVKWIQRRVLVPLELLSFAFMVVLYSLEIPSFWGLYGGYLLFMLWNLRYHSRHPFPQNLKQRLTVWLDYFYVEWIPVVILVHLSWPDYRLLLLLLLHTILFPNAIRNHGKTLAEGI